MFIPDKSSLLRWLKFNAVGIMGTAVQLSTLAVLLRILGLHFIWATALAVEISVIHNFCWHWRWTWADRQTGGIFRMVTTLVRFNLSNGLISLTGTLLCTAMLTSFANIDPILANILSWIPCWFANYLVSDRFVFLSPNAGECI